MSTTRATPRPVRSGQTLLVLVAFLTLGLSGCVQDPDRTSSGDSLGDSYEVFGYFEEFPIEAGNTTLLKAAVVGHRSSGFMAENYTIRIVLPEGLTLVDGAEWSGRIENGEMDLHEYRVRAESEGSWWVELQYNFQPVSGPHSSSESCAGFLNVTEPGSGHAPMRWDKGFSTFPDEVPTGRCL